MKAPTSKAEFEAMNAAERRAWVRLVSLIGVAGNERALWPSEAAELRKLAASFGISLEFEKVHV